MFPLAVYMTKAFGWTLGIFFVVLSSRKVGTLQPEDVTACSIGRPRLLLYYRLAMLGWALFIGLTQLLVKGPLVFVFYTVWNWWLLTAFFALASAASMRAWLQEKRHRRSQKAKQQAQQPCGMDWLCKATLATFCVVTPMSFAVDLLTWLVLAPMIAGLPDPARVLLWRQRVYCFESYNQHGVNAVMMLGELLLNRIPVDLYSAGWLALWSSLFGVWSAVFHRKTGRFIYPFLDAHKPYAWAAYLGLFAVHWVAYLTVMGLSRAKQRLLYEKEPIVAAVPSASYPSTAEDSGNSTAMPLPEHLLLHGTPASTEGGGASKHKES